MNSAKRKILVHNITYGFPHYRYFGHGNGGVLSILCFCFLLIHEYRLNSEDEVMIMPKIWYPCLFMVPWQMIVKNILQTLGQGTLQSNSVFFLLPTIITFVIHGVIIPISMINRSKKCKKFVLKKVLIPFVVCRNLRWILKRYVNKYINFIQAA